MWIRLVVALLVCLARGLEAIAAADETGYDAFYTPPDPLPSGQPGDLIRTEPSRLVPEPSGQLGAFMATGTRIMYRSTDARGNPVAITGTYFEPRNPWPGRGQRPLIAYAPGTEGQGDQRAPSRLFNQGIHFSSGLDITFGYEEMFVATMVSRGFAVVVTDYERLGTPGGAHLRQPTGPRPRITGRSSSRATITGHVGGCARSGGAVGLFAGWRSVRVGGRVGAWLCS